MSNDKQYPLTESKKKALRSQGIVPYSRFSVRAFFLAIVCFLGAKYHSKFADHLLDHSFKSTFHSLDANNTIYYVVKFMITSSIFGFSLILFLGFLNTAFLFLPYNKHPEGVRSKIKTNSLTTKIKNSILLLLFFLLLLIAAAVTLTISKALFSNSNLEISSLQAIYLIKVIPFSLFLNSVGLLLLLTSLISYVYVKLNFYSLHKMTREELIQEGRET